MKKALLQYFILVTAFISICFCSYSVLHPLLILPYEDRTFLESKPDMETVLKKLGSPSMKLHSGERFPMQGWHPLPDHTVSGTGLAFGRRYGGMLYMFFDSRGDMEHFVISRS